MQSIPEQQRKLLLSNFLEFWSVGLYFLPAVAKVHKLQQISTVLQETTMDHCPDRYNDLYMTQGTPEIIQP